VAILFLQPLDKGGDDKCDPTEVKMVVTRRINTKSKRVIRRSSNVRMLIRIIYRLRIVSMVFRQPLGKWLGEVICRLATL